MSKKVKKTAKKLEKTINKALKFKPEMVKKGVKKQDFEIVKKKCPECDGEGEIDITVRAPRIVKCEVCDGTGERND